VRLGGQRGLGGRDVDRRGGIGGDGHTRERERCLSEPRLPAAPLRPERGAHVQSPHGAHALALQLRRRRQRLEDALHRLGRQRLKQIGCSDDLGGCRWRFAGPLRLGGTGARAVFVEAGHRCSTIRGSEAQHHQWRLRLTACCIECGRPISQRRLECAEPAEEHDQRERHRTEDDEL